MSSIVHHFNSIGWIWNWSYRPETLNSDWNWWYFVRCYLEIRWMTLENNRAHLLYYIKLCASFQIHRWNQSCVTIRKILIRVDIDFFCPVGPWNSMDDIEIQKGHLFYTTLSFVHHFKAMGEFKLESGVTVRKRSIPVKISIFLYRVTLKFDRWPWKTVGHLSYAASGFVHHFIAVGEFKMELQKKKKKITITWILPGVTVQKRQNCFFLPVTLTYELWPWPFSWKSLLSLQ